MQLTRDWIFEISIDLPRVDSQDVFRSLKPLCNSRLPFALRQPHLLCPSVQKQALRHHKYHLICSVDSFAVDNYNIALWQGNLIIISVQSRRRIDSSNYSGRSAHSIISIDSFAVDNYISAQWKGKLSLSSVQSRRRIVSSHYSDRSVQPIDSLSRYYKSRIDFCVVHLQIFALWHLSRVIISVQSRIELDFGNWPFMSRRSITPYGYRAIRAHSLPPSPNDIDSVDATSKEDAEEVIRRQLKPFADRIKLLAEGQNIMQADAQTVVTELQGVVHSINRQQEMLQMVVETQKIQMGEYQRQNQSRAALLTQQQEEMHANQTQMNQNVHVMGQEIGAQHHTHNQLRSTLEEEAVRVRVRYEQLQQQLNQMANEATSSTNDNTIPRAEDRQRRTSMGSDDRDIRRVPLVSTAERRSSMDLGGTRSMEEPKQVVAINASVRAAPKFSADHYHRWKDEVMFWKEIHPYSTEDALLAELALGSEGVLRTIMVAFLKDTRGQLQQRTLGRLFLILDSSFKREASEQAIQRMGKFNKFKKEGQEDIKAFWIRYQKMIGDIKSCGLTITPEMEFVRAISALSLSDHHRMSVLAAMSNHPNPHCPETLKTITRRLFQGDVDEGEILLQQPNGETWVEGEEEWEETTFTANTKGKTRNRPGLEKAALSNTRRLMNFPNTEKGKGKGKPSKQETFCWRCGSRDHIARNCHLPFQPVLAFGKTGKGGQPASAKGENIMLADTIVPEAEKSSHDIVDGCGQAAVNPSFNETGSNVARSQETLEHYPMFSGSEEYEWMPDDEWLSQWWSDTFLMSDSGPKPTFNRMLPWVMPAPTESELPVEIPEHHALIDSGASYSVAGLPWIRKWCGEAQENIWKKLVLEAIDSSDLAVAWSTNPLEVSY